MDEKTSKRVASIGGQAQNMSAQEILADILNRGLPAAEEIAAKLHSLAGTAMTQARDRKREDVTEEPDDGPPRSPP